MFTIPEPNPCVYPKAVKCANGGQCRAKGKSYQCVCANGYTGKHCDTSENNLK